MGEKTEKWFERLAAPSPFHRPPPLRQTFREVCERLHIRRRTTSSSGVQSVTTENPQPAIESKTTAVQKDKPEKGPVLVEFKTNFSLDADLEKNPFTTAKERLLSHLLQGLMKLYNRNELHFLISIEEVDLYFKGTSEPPSYLMTVQPADELDQPTVGDLVSVLQERIRVSIAIQSDRGLIRILPHTPVAPCQWMLFESSDDSRKSEISGEDDNTQNTKSGSQDGKDPDTKGPNTIPPESEQKPGTAPQQDRPIDDQQSKTTHEGAVDKNHPGHSTA